MLAMLVAAAVRGIGRTRDLADDPPSSGPSSVRRKDRLHASSRAPGALVTISSPPADRTRCSLEARPTWPSSSAASRRDGVEPGAVVAHLELDPLVVGRDGDDDVATRRCA